VADYFGVNAIARRMSVHGDTIRRWHRQLGFLMYRRFYRHPVQGVKRVWYTNDQLIQAWEIAQARRDLKLTLDARTKPQPQSRR
jgi:DNA-binding MurR/RpiR family transcriptional regulator